MSDSQKSEKGSIILKALIVVLVVVLYFIISTPWQAKVAADKLKLDSRVKMSQIRSGELVYVAAKGEYSSSIAELISFIKRDPYLSTKIDSVFNVKDGSNFNLETLNISPVTGTEYKYQVDNASAVKKYLLECPGGSGSIGSMDDEEKVNKSSWEN